MAMGGNKLRKLEFLAADALREGADTLITAGAIQSNHVRQTAAVAAKLGLHCVALLENPIGTHRGKLFNQRQSFVAGSVQRPGRDVSTP